MAQNTVHYTIAHRRPDGRPDFVYPWDGKLAACVLSSINICRGMLQYPKIRAAFLSFAREFNRTHQGAWYHDPRHKFETMEGVISAFLKAILKSFPIVYVDDGINNPGCLAAHPRQEWDGIFQPRDQSILVNGSRVRDMVAAMTRAEQTNDPNDHEHKRFRSFNFIFANTFLHEIGHVFLTFLTKGRTVTPCHINAEVVGYSGEHRGEAGRNLETIILGGTLEYYRDHTDDDSQPGVPHLLTKDGVRRISRESIDAAASYCFYAGHSPYRLEGPILDPRKLERLGDHYPRAILTDPIEWIIADAQRPYDQQVYVGPRSPIHRMPFHPDFVLRPRAQEPESRKR